MKKKNEALNQFIDIVDLQDNIITFEDIDYISKDLKTSLQYKSEFSSDLYPDILLYITHKIFSKEEAVKVWMNIVHHRTKLKEQLERDPGVLVACLDYMTNIEPMLDEPKIIEKGKSDYIIATTLIDKLTNLYIRNVFDIVLIKEYSLALRSGLPLSLIMIDIDDFKKINDMYGHMEGDRVLKSIGRIINSNIRVMDFAARFGGEELVLILANTDIKMASKLAEIIRQKVEKINILPSKVTISMGVSYNGPLTKDVKDLILLADKALYYSKEHGKNMVAIHSESGIIPYSDKL